MGQAHPFKARRRKARVVGASLPEIGLEVDVGYYCDRAAIVRDFDNAGAWQLGLLGDLHFPARELSLIHI